MPRDPEEPAWLVAQIVRAIHDDLLAQHGGLFGLRDKGLFESALARPRHRWADGNTDDLFDCAASYGFGLAKNHEFNDGNKRTAFQAMYTFLGVNGCDLRASEAEAVEIMVGVADGTVSEKRLPAPPRGHSTTPPRRR